MGTQIWRGERGRLRKSRGLNLANVGGLRARSSLKQAIAGEEEDEEDCRPWRRRLSMAITWGSVLRITLLLLLVAAITTACFRLPVEKILKDFLLWIEQNKGPWGPLVLAVSYIPLTVLAVPASVLTLGGGYLFGLPVGFVADSIGATIGSTAAFLLGRTIGRQYVTSKLKDYPQFQAVAIAIQRSGFKIVLLLRLVPLLPFNMLNYLLSVTPVGIGEYMIASWLGTMLITLPITLALVYAGTTLKDISDVTHGWGEISPTHWGQTENPTHPRPRSILACRCPWKPLRFWGFDRGTHREPLGLTRFGSFLLETTGELSYLTEGVHGGLSKFLDARVGQWTQRGIDKGLLAKWSICQIDRTSCGMILMIWVTKVAKSALDKALAENVEVDDVLASPQLPVVADPPSDLRQPLIIKIDGPDDNHEN
ncbi:hypothetical protein ACLOJK_025952 [Asimina triloba]